MRRVPVAAATVIAGVGAVGVAVLIRRRRRRCEGFEERATVALVDGCRVAVGSLAETSSAPRRQLPLRQSDLVEFWFGRALQHALGGCVPAEMQSLVWPFLDEAAGCRKSLRRARVAVLEAMSSLFGPEGLRNATAMRHLQHVDRRLKEVESEACDDVWLLTRRGPVERFCRLCDEFGSREREGVGDRKAMPLADQLRTAVDLILEVTWEDDLSKIGLYGSHWKKNTNAFRP